MGRTRYAVKRQKVAAVESALFNPDVVFLLAGLLDARDLCQVSLTCKALGGKRAAAPNGPSLVEEAARRLFECATEWERSCLPKYPSEGWIVLYHHLLLLRSKLTFDQLVGPIVYCGDDRSNVLNSTLKQFSALCSNHVMRSGRHFSVFTFTPARERRSTHCMWSYLGIVRPVNINTSDPALRDLSNVFNNGGELKKFHPMMPNFWEYLRAQRTDRWGESNVHCCKVSLLSGFGWCDWRRNRTHYRSISGFNWRAPFGLLLDLDEGVLALYQNGQRLEVLKDGLSGEYCWYTTAADATFTVMRGLAPAD